MGPKERLWLGLGIFLLITGILSYLSQQEELKRSTAGSEQVSAQSSDLVGGSGAEMPDPDARRETRAGNSDSEFVVDPVRGVVQKDEGAKYFQ